MKVTLISASGRDLLDTLARSEHPVEAVFDKNFELMFREDGAETGITLVLQSDGRWFVKAELGLIP